MTTTTLPREGYCELWLNAWTPVTPLQNQTITINRGRLDWAADVSPSTMSLLLDDPTGILRPDDPTGTYYGLLNRNTPMRFGYVLLTDTFGRTSTDTWGTTTPQVTVGTVRSTRTSTYTLSGTAADFDVAAGVGTMFIAANSTKRRAYLAADTGHRNVDVQVDMNLPTPGSGSVIAGIMLRGTSTSDYVAVDADVNSSGTVRIAIRDHTDNVYLVTTTTVSGVVATTIRMRVQVEGDTIRGKLWNTSGSEPYGWHATAVDPDMAYAGWVGLRAETNGNTNITHTFDNLTIRSPRFFGVAGKLQPKTDESGRNKWVSVTGRGIRGRMERNKANNRSTALAYLTAPPLPLDYWPLTGGSLSEAGTNSVSGRQDLRPFVGTHPSGAVFAAPQWGSGTLGPWLEPGISRAAGGSVTVLWAPVYMPAFTTTWTVDLMYASAAGGDDVNCVIDINPTYLGGATNPWIQLIINAAGGEIGVAHLSGTETFESGVTLFDGIAHHVRWTATQSGGTVNISFYIDGVLVNTAGEAGTLPAITSIGYVAGGSGTIGFAQGHAAIYLNPPSVTDTTDAVLGYRGETAGNRLARLCDDNGIGFSYVGDLDDTQVMGPQYADSLLQVMDECAETDGGTLVESRMADGFVYITGHAHYNRTTGLSLSLSNHELNDKFDPVFDDQAIRNKITARRRSGGTYTAEQTTGPNNTGDPSTDPQAVGVYDTQFTINPETDTQLTDAAWWELALGTTTTPRVPDITVNAANQHLTTLQDDQLLSMDVDDRLVVTSLSSRGMYDDFTQLARGYTETLATIFVNEFTFTTTPEEAYHVGVWDDTAFRWDSTDSTLNGAHSSSTTSLSVAFTTLRWSTSTGLPAAIMVGGEKMTLTAVSGTTSPQTFTVTRSVNGVTKSHATGTAVHLDHRSRWGRGN